MRFHDPRTAVWRVMFALPSPAMGGYSRWAILQDDGLAPLGAPFAAPPDVVAGILADRATALFGMVHRRAAEDAQ